MKAIILAAGYATRLYPLTINRPKALLPIGGRPILDYIMDNIARMNAVDTLYVVSNAKFYEDFEKWAKDCSYPFAIEVINDNTTTDENKLGAIGDMKFVIDQKNIDDDLLVLAGDNYFTFELADFYAFYQKCGADCVVAQENNNVEDLKRMAVAKIDQDGKVLHLEEKPQNPQSNVAVYATYLYQKETLKKIDAYLEEGNSPDAPGNFPSWLYKKQPVHLYLFKGECYDIGTPQSYKMVDDMLSGK